VNQGEVVHIVRDLGVLSEAWLPESIAAAGRLGWQPWIVATGTLHAGAEQLEPSRRRWLVPQPPRRARRMRDLATLRTVADRRSAALLAPLRTVRPALAHAHLGWTAAEARQATVEAGVPLVTTFHGSDLLVYPGRRRAWDYRRLFRSVAEVIVVSEFLADRLPVFGFRRRPHVIPMGIDLDRLPYRGPLSDRPHVLFVGRLVGFKGADVLLRAIPAVRAAVPEATFELIGDGPLRGRCEELARSLGIAGHVRFLGALPRAEVYGQMARAPLVVVPSREAENASAEARSVVAMEAMALGAAVVATDNGGLPETIPPEHRADLARQGDPEALAAALVERLTRPETWGERAAVARGWVERTFAWPVVARQIGDVYAAAAGS
jgi:colanic acid/amylovoran biosynthesis glycosyltransferase